MFYFQKVLIIMLNCPIQFFSDNFALISALRKHLRVHSNNGILEFSICATYVRNAYQRFKFIYVRSGLYTLMLMWIMRLARTKTLKVIELILGWCSQGKNTLKKWKLSFRTRRPSREFFNRKFVKNSFRLNS